MKKLTFPVVDLIDGYLLGYAKRASDLDIVGNDDCRAWMAGRASQLVADSAGVLWEVVGRTPRAPPIHVLPWIVLPRIGTGGNVLYAPAQLAEARSLSVADMCSLLLGWVRKRSEATGRLWDPDDWEAYEEWHDDFGYRAENCRTHAALISFVGRWAESGSYG